MCGSRTETATNPGRRALFIAAGAALATATLDRFLPAVSFAAETNRREETRTITGRFEAGAPDWWYLPVEIPRGVREIEVVYTYDRPPVPPGTAGNALDIGIFSPAGHDLGNARGFRGWSGGFRDRFTISASAATPGYLPGPITPGTWHIILGPYTIAPQGMEYRVDITLRYGSPGRRFVPTPAPEQARGRGRAWYRGDCHLHTQHSDGVWQPEDLAAAARAAGLDFIASTEHNTTSASLQWGRHAGEDLLIVDGEEITTRSGHWLALGLPPGYWIDWRYRFGDSGQFRRFAQQVRAVGGLVVAAHPYCPYVGCPWEFGYDDVDAVEVWNGPWTLDDQLAVQTWDELLRRAVTEARRGHGHRPRWIPAIGNSDSHNSSQTVGLPQTVVQADALTTRHVLAGLRAGRSWLAESAHVQLRMTARSGGRTAGIGEYLRTGARTEILLEVEGAPNCQIQLLTPEGLAYTADIPGSGAATVRWEVPAGTAWVRAEIRRPVPTQTTPDTMVALTNPIFLGI